MRANHFKKRRTIPVLQHGVGRCAGPNNGTGPWGGWSKEVLNFDSTNRNAESGAEFTGLDVDSLIRAGQADQAPKMQSRTYRAQGRIKQAFPATRRGSALQKNRLSLNQKRRSYRRKKIPWKKLKK